MCYNNNNPEGSRLPGHFVCQIDVYRAVAPHHHTTTSLRGSAHTAVAIPIDFRAESANLMGIATPACGLVRDDSLLITERQTEAYSAFNASMAAWI